jgi:hypothetical protein
MSIVLAEGFNSLLNNGNIIIKGNEKDTGFTSLFPLSLMGCRT